MDFETFKNKKMNALDNSVIDDSDAMSSKVLGNILSGQQKIFGDGKIHITPPSILQTKTKIDFHLDSNAWARIGQTKRQQLMNIMRDSDRDGVPDVFDCSPYNAKKQALIHKIINFTQGQGFVENKPKQNNVFQDLATGQVQNQQIVQQPKRDFMDSIIHYRKKGLQQEKLAEQRRIAKAQELVNLRNKIYQEQQAKFVKQQYRKQAKARLNLQFQQAQQKKMPVDITKFTGFGYSGFSKVGKINTKKNIMDLI